MVGPQPITEKLEGGATSTAFPARPLNIPERVKEFQKGLSLVEKVLETISRRRAMVESLELINSMVKSGQKDILDEMQEESDAWNGVADFYRRAIAHGTAEASDLIKLHAAAVGNPVANGSVKT